MKKFSLLIALLCVLSLLFCLCSCDVPQDGGGTGEEPPAQQETYFTITPETVIIRAENSKEHVEAAQLLREKLEEILGYQLTFRTDFGDKRYASEILVGATNREIANEFYDGLTSMDYGYAALEESTLVISGGNGQSSIQAVNYFLETAFGASESTPGTAVPVLVGKADTVKYQYPVTSLTIGGKPLSDFTIQYSGSATEDAAYTLAELIERLCGTELPVARASATLKTAESILIEQDKLMGSYMTGYESKGSSFVIRGSSDRIEMAVEYFINEVLGEDPKGEINIEKTDGLVRNVLFTEDEYYDFELQEITDVVQVCPGVKRYTRHYLDRDGNPIKAYVIECAPGSVKPMLGTTNGAYEITYQQSILEQIRFEEENMNVDICAAVNGCFYSWVNQEIGFQASGLLVKNGQVINDYAPTVFQAFGVKKDGSYYFGTPGSGDVEYEDLEFCVSGAFLLMKDGALYDMGLTWPDQGIVKDRHPRTGVGAKEDGTLYFVVVDGRQKAHSNGATLPDLALVFHELGCSDAVNLDGGGSSISYTKDYESGEYIYWNSPSDGKPREILCCTLLARNPDYKEEE